MFKVDNPDYANIKQNDSSFNLNSLGEVKYEDTKVLIFHVIRKGNLYNMEQEDYK